MYIYDFTVSRKLKILPWFLGGTHPNKGIWWLLTWSITWWGPTYFVPLQIIIVCVMREYRSSPIVEYPALTLKPMVRPWQAHSPAVCRRSSFLHVKMNSCGCNPFADAKKNEINQLCDAWWVMMMSCERNIMLDNLPFSWVLNMRTKLDLTSSNTIFINFQPKIKKMRVIYTIELMMRIKYNYIF